MRLWHGGCVIVIENKRVSIIAPFSSIDIDFDTDTCIDILSNLNSRPISQGSATPRLGNPALFHETLKSNGQYLGCVKKIYVTSSNTL